jgi:ABC-type multidrug transport system ATPase subunit
VVIARSIYSKPSLLLLDEFTSAVDATTASTALHYMMKQADTVVWVTQSFPRTIMQKEIDLILVMHEKKLVENGTHDELMKIEGGHYRRKFEAYSGKQLVKGVSSKLSRRIMKMRRYHQELLSAYRSKYKRRNRSNLDKTQSQQSKRNAMRRKNKAKESDSKIAKVKQCED